ncbi:MAG: DUF933 domain-containing protein, partial [Desulfatibacillaceae bacterium]|nr:DUF933 domain-containing protein [Desulfatibacillaceae bacterium]
MQLGIIGLAQSGKATLFEALTGGAGQEKKGEQVLAVVDVPDGRVDILSQMYKPKKTTHAKVQYLAAPRMAAGDRAKAAERLMGQIRNCDALIHVVRNFADAAGQAPKPAADFAQLDEELIFADLLVAEKKIERYEADAKRGKKPDLEEKELLEQCLAMLNSSVPLRRNPQIAQAKALRGFAFLSAKPLLVVFNNEDEDPNLPQGLEICSVDPCMAVRARLEQELGRMAPDEAGAFLEEFGVDEPARDKMIAASYKLLGLISFFTVGEDEVRAWTIKQDTPAQQAAGAIHTDLEKGFIRAEVVSYDDLVAAGNINEARRQGTLRLEGKTYPVKDGDIV